MIRNCYLKKCNDLVTQSLNFRVRFFFLFYQSSLLFAFVELNIFYFLDLWDVFIVSLWVMSKRLFASAIYVQLTFVNVSIFIQVAYPWYKFLFLTHLQWTPYTAYFFYTTTFTWGKLKNSPLKTCPHEILCFPQLGLSHSQVNSFVNREFVIVENAIIYWYFESLTGK